MLEYFLLVHNRIHIKNLLVGFIQGSQRGRFMKKEVIDHQKVSRGGQDFAILPYSVFLDLVRGSTEQIDTEELTRLHLEDGRILVSEWRKCLNLSQEAVAEKLGIPLVALDLLEKSGAKLRKTTIQQLAATLDLTPAKAAA